MQWRAILYALGGLVWAALPMIAESQGLVPCGVSNQAVGTQGYNLQSISCNLCDVGKLLQNIVNWLLVISIPLSTALFAYAGWLFFTSGVNPGQRERGKKVFSSVLIGFAVALGAWVLVQTTLKILLTNDAYKRWDQIQCDKVGRLDQAQRTLGELVNSVLPRLDNRPIKAVTGGVTYDTYSGCAEGSTWSPTVKGCRNADGEVLPPVATPQQMAKVAPGDCSPENIMAAAADGEDGVELTYKEAQVLSCLSTPESNCNNSAYPKWATPAGGCTPGVNCSSAMGVFQVTRGYSDDNHSLNFQSCTQAAIAAGYADVVSSDGYLNCAQAFRGGVNNGSRLAKACDAAAQNFTCNTQAAAGLVADKYEKNPNQSGAQLFSDWTADPKSSKQKQCIQQYY